MSDTTRDRLAQIAQRVEAATTGPWRADDEHGLMPEATPAWCVSREGTGGEYLGDVAYTTGPREPQDAEFIAHARTDIPAMHAALTAVLALHQPETDGPYSLLPDWEFCSCGAMEPFADDDGYASLRPARYPCPTRRAINDALGGE
jgi:hypothetical protein